jgi:hypothetical protein
MIYSPNTALFFSYLSTRPSDHNGGFTSGPKKDAGFKARGSDAKYQGE